ncbi:MAG: ADP-glyceromanno-heptose 6-epimerase [Pseudomonadota bacterium]
MIVVTGGAGFIGSNIVRALNARGERDIVIVDDLSDGYKYRNIVDTDIADLVEPERFRRTLEDDALGFSPRAVFHQGACADTTVWDGRYMLDTNYTLSQELYRYTARHHCPFIYASSAAVYGLSTHCRETSECEVPLNVYGYSKLLFDRWVRRQRIEHQCVGLRYFNVYGPGETHKGPMASMAWQLREQLLADGKLKLFAQSGGYGAGEQRRDFVYVDDLVSVVLWFYDHPDGRGIFNVGTGTSQAFNDIARSLIDFYGRGEVQYIPFPAHLEGVYQHFTQADLTQLRSTGCDVTFVDVEVGVRRYMERLRQDPTHVMLSA